MSLNLEGYSLTFSDEFTGDYVDANVWGTKYWWGGRSLSSNGEKQYFADRSTQVVQKHPHTDPFKITADPTEAEDGILTITALPSPDTSLTDGLPYVSGMINTHGTFSQTYGYFEIDAKVPTGQGLWPAFWMLPQSGNWPPEIDVLELLGKDPTTYYVGSHWSGTDGSHQYQTTGISTGIDLSQGFHTYGTMWTPDTITFYLDGQKVCSMATPPGVNEPMYLLAGLAVGGNWGGDPDASTVFPAAFKIDSIKVWSAPETKPAGQTLIGTSSADTLTGGAGDDMLSGLSGNDKLYGLAGADRLVGGDGADQLFGGDSIDTLIGGRGKDSISGGADADVFVFEALSDSTTRAKDTISDFVSGIDLINLRLLDADTKVGGDQAFTFISSSAFSGEAGQLRFASGVLSGDVNGDKKVDFEVAVTGATSLKTADFYL